MTGMKKSYGMRKWMLVMTVMVMSIFLLIPKAQAEAAKKPSVKLRNVTNISTSNARLNAVINNPGKTWIRRVGIVLYNRNGKQLTNRYATVNYRNKSYSVAMDLNNWYGKLSAGTYYKYKVYVRTLTGKTYYSALSSFTTKQAVINPTMSVKGVSGLTATNVQINATVNNPSRINLKKCGFLLYNSKGSLVANKYDNINYTYSSFNTWFNMNEYGITLNSATIYKYRFYVVNASGQYFYSSLYALKTSTKVNNSATKKLSYQTSKIQEIGAQPAGSVTCSAYAISYARAVAGKTPYNNPMAYWSNKYGAMWGWGGMTSRKYNTAQAALKAVYDQIKAGRPAILYVWGSGKNGTYTTSGHYVTVIGYQNVTNVNALNMNQFTIIDPGFAKEISLGKYSGTKWTSSGGYQVITF